MPTPLVITQVFTAQRAYTFALSHFIRGQQCMISHVAVEAPCRPGCSGLSYCSTLNNRPLQMFRTCDRLADSAARATVQLWESHTISVPLAFDIPVKGIARPAQCTTWLKAMAVNSSRSSGRRGLRASLIDRFPNVFIREYRRYAPYVKYIFLFIVCKTVFTLLTSDVVIVVCS